MKNFTLLFIILCLASKGFTQAGTLDSTFSGDGKVLTGFKKKYASQQCLALQNDGRIVVGGIVSGPHFNNCALVRYMPKGKLDSSFGIDGKLFTDLQYIFSIAVQANEKIIVRSYADTNSNLIRYSKNGDIDSSFGNNGKAIPDFGGYFALDADEKIVYAGDVSKDGTNNDLAVERFTKNGKLDSSFGINGQVVTDFGKDETIRAVAIQPNGKIVVVGLYYDYPKPSPNFYFALARYNHNGSLDSTFGINGKEISDFGFDAVPQGIAIQNDGKIVVTGYPYVDYFLTVRYKPNGNIDGSFGNKGKVLTSFSYISNTVAIQTNGKIVVEGNRGMIRYKINGDIDSSFGINGKVLFDIISNYSGTYSSMAIQPDGNIVIGGSIYVPQRNNGEFIVERYKGDSVFFTFTTNTIVQKQDAITSKPAGIYLSPNPAKDVVRIQGLSSKTINTISIIDYTGKILQTAITSSNNYTFNVQQLPAGIYFIKIDDGKNIRTLKFVKE